MNHELSPSARIINSALAYVDEQYGTGYPEYAPGEQQGYAYHNGYHSRCVVSDFERLAQALDMSPAERRIGMIASSAHDLIQGKGRHCDEAESGQWVADVMRREGVFNEPHISMAQLGIAGTVPLFEDGRMVGQQASMLAYPSKMHEGLAKAVASADLGRLYSLDGPFLAHLLLREIVKPGEGESVPYETIVGFQRGQVPFLEEYRFPHPAAEKVLASHKGEVIAYVGSLLSALESGAIQTWDEVIASDIEFMESGLSQ